MGDMNARIGNVQTQPITWNELDRNDQITIACTWQRVSQDNIVNAYRGALCNLMHGMHLMVLNEMHLFPPTHVYLLYNK